MIYYVDISCVYIVREREIEGVCRVDLYGKLHLEFIFYSNYSSQLDCVDVYLNYDKVIIILKIMPSHEQKRAQITIHE